MTATAPPRPALSFTAWPAYRLGVWAFLINEAFLFASILAAGLFLRFGGIVPWPRPGDALALGPVILATLILIGSSATLNESLDALRRGNETFTRAWLRWTLFAGVAFLLIQIYEWRDLWITAQELSKTAGVPVVSNPWGAPSFVQVFLLATLLHGLHVILGLGLMSWLLVTGTEGHEPRLESVALYWHFADLVWIFIFSSLYLV